MNKDRLSLPPLQRIRYDDEFITATLDTINSVGYVRMADQTKGELGDNLEQMRAWALDLTAGTPVDHEERDINPVAVRNLARLGFIGTFYFPSGKILDKDAPDEIRALGAYSHYQRLFVDTPNSD